MDFVDLLAAYGRKCQLTRAMPLKGVLSQKLGFGALRILKLLIYPGNCQKGCEHHNNSKMPVASMKMGEGVVSSLWLVHCHVLFKIPRPGGGCSGGKKPIKI